MFALTMFEDAVVITKPVSAGKVRTVSLAKAAVAGFTVILLVPLPVASKRFISACAVALLVIFKSPADAVIFPAVAVIPPDVAVIAPAEVTVPVSYTHLTLPTIYSV